MAERTDSRRVRSALALAFVLGWAPALYAQVPDAALRTDAGRAPAGDAAPSPDAAAPSREEALREGTTPDAADDAGAPSIPPAPAAKPQPKPEPPSKPASAPRREKPDASGEAEPKRPDAGEEPAPPRGDESETEAQVARYHDTASPLVFRVAAHGKAPSVRAREATRALSAALDQRTGNRDPEIVVRVEDGIALVRIDGDVITTYYEEDADFEGVPLRSLASRVETELRGFVPTELRRKAIQLFALHVFLSVFVIVMAFLTLKALRAAFQRWDAALDEKRGNLPPVTLFRIPVISGEGLGGALALGLALGRVASYAIVVVTVVASVLGQFETTRPLLSRLGKGSAEPILRGFQNVVSAIPGLLLAALLVVGIQAGLRVLNLLLDGVQGQQIVWKRLPPLRVPVFRAASRWLVILIAAPLVIAAAFGRFGSPLEDLALFCGAALLLAAVPTLTSFVVGALVLWLAEIRHGEWVQVGQVSGEVTAISFHELRLVPDDGGTVSVPMLYLLLHPLKRLRRAPAVSFTLRFSRDRPVRDLIESLRAAATAAEPTAVVECSGVGDRAVAVCFSVSAEKTGARDALLFAIGDAVDRKEFRLVGDPPPGSAEC